MGAMNEAPVTVGTGPLTIEQVVAVDDPAQALVRARELTAPGGYLLVTGSLYLLADLVSIEEAVG